MRQGRTSVVIPCYKEDRYLAQALESTAKQTEAVAEIIVVDDGSPTALKQPLSWQGPPLRWIRTTNQGLGAARNVGIHQAKSEFVALLDADDFWEPTKIAKQQALLDENPSAVACYTQCVDEEGFFGFGPYPDTHLPSDAVAAMLWGGQFFPPSSVLARREALVRVGGFREGLVNGEDLDMWFRLFTLGEIFGVPERLTWYPHPSWANYPK